MALEDQPSYIIEMRAEPGTGERPFRLATAGMATSSSSDRFIMLREDADPDVLWNIEVFRSVQAEDAHESSDTADQLREEIIDLLAEPPVRIEAHPYSAIPALPGDSD